ncbi:auxin-responsive protein SAUR78-like [Impatiens glandulifera]|uniref:auxin-responsive protein SAUR78-like n=1 Tax=Impatiens glandulifera TaxID=253017 RepID=UPI001FB19D0E|nr:auxin-responsive protein SAUR78-like [Impatiens glandulifera]
MKSGKLRKLLKNWPSLSKRISNNERRANATGADVTPVGNVDDDAAVDIVFSSSSGTENLQAVYVGRSRRQYFVTSEVINHPLFQVLVDKSEVFGEASSTIVVSCEVVLFEHLLWMLKNTDSSTYFDSNSMDELVEFYTC